MASLAVTAIFGCGSESDPLADIPDALPPLVEIEDQIGFSLAQLKYMYEQREANLDDGVVVLGADEPFANGDAVSCFVDRLFGLVVEQEDLGPVEGAERVTEMIASYTGVAVDVVRSDVERSLADVLVSTAALPR